MTEINLPTAIAVCTWRTVETVVYTKVDVEPLTVFVIVTGVVVRYTVVFSTSVAKSSDVMTSVLPWADTVAVAVGVMKLVFGTTSVTVETVVYTEVAVVPFCV